MIELSLSGAIIDMMMIIIFAMIGESIVREIRTQLYEKILNMPVSWFAKEENQSEKITFKINSSSKVLYNFIKNTYAMVLTATINMVAGVGISLFYDWRTGLTTLALIPLIVISHLIQISFIKGFSETSGKIYENSTQIVNENIINIRTTLSLGGTDSVLNRYF